MSTPVNPWSHYLAQPGPPLDPQKYPHGIGPNGQHFGQQPGHTYDASTDTYIPNKGEHNDALDQAGYTVPGSSDALLQQAGTLGALGVGASIPNAVGWLANHLFPSAPGGHATQTGSGLLGNLFGSTTPAADTAAPAASSAGAGLLGGAAPTASQVAPGLADPFGGLASGGALPESAAASGAGTAGTAGTAGQGLLGLSGASPLLGAAGIAAGAGTGFEQGKGLYDFTQGQSLSVPEEAALALPTFGLSLLANPIEDALGIGHSQNYYDGLDRKNEINALSDKYDLGNGLLNFAGDNGQNFSLSADDYRKNPLTYNFDQSQASMPIDIGASNPLAAALGLDVGSKGYTDLSGGLANLVGQGLSPEDLYKKFGLNHDSAYADIVNNSALTQAQKDPLLNGLDQAFSVGAYGPGGSASG